MLARPFVTSTLLVSLVSVGAVIPPARAQTAVAPAAPAEIQPGHPAPTDGSAAGGAAHDGVITPPVPTGDAAIVRGAPTGNGATPVIPPPGSPGGNPTVVPK